MADFVQTLMTTLAVGSLYALIALGYTMVYGILKFINFAHSDIVVLGAWISYTLATKILPMLGLDPHNPETAPPLWVGGVILLAAMVDVRPGRVSSSSGWPTRPLRARRGSTC